MAKIVAAFASTHNPRIFWTRDEADPAEVRALDRAFGQLREGLAAAKPDAIVMFGNDHMDQFFLDSLPTFAIATSAELAGPFWYEQEIMKMPRYRTPVAGWLAEDLLRHGVEAGFGLSRASAARIDHAFTLPLSYLRPEGDIPVVPVITNVFGYPIASGERFRELGRMIRAFAAARPADERLAVIASFNMTVEVGGPKMGNYNKAFNDRVLELMAAGEAETMVRNLTVPRLIAEGNSTAEFLNYLALLGVVGERRPNFIRHEPIRGIGLCPVVMWENLS